MFINNRNGKQKKATKDKGQAGTGEARVGGSGGAATLILTPASTTWQ